MKSMKRILLSLVVLLALAHFAAADEVAVMNIKVDGEKQLRRVVIEFYENDAPDTVANFKKLARKGFYKGIAFHRVIPHTLVQAGDPLSRHRDRSKIGTQGPGYTLPAEIHRKHTEGAVAMARLADSVNPARRSNGSQFYICLKPQPQLDGQYTVFGHVIEGLDALDQISTRPADSNDNPMDRIVIKSVRIEPRS
jgi:peptidyl-prolyl cis-trans isomerase B (cyclophilin B)